MCLQTMEASPGQSSSGEVTSAQEEGEEEEEEEESVEENMEGDTGPTDPTSRGDGEKCCDVPEVGEELYVSLSSTGKDPMIQLVVAGRYFSIARSVLLSFPQTVLGQLALRDQASPRPDKTYLFDRNPKMMNSILDLYRTGELHLPKNMCGIAIFRELRFWGIDDRLVSECCWQKYKEALKEIVVVDELEKIMSHSNAVLTDSWRSRIWLTMEKPGFNKASWVWFTIYMIFIGLSIIVVTLSTVDEFREGRDGQKEDLTGQTVLERLLNTQLNPALVALDTTGLIFFTLEPLVRLLVAPDLRYHLKQPLNIMDIFLAADHWACFIMEQNETMLDTDEVARVLHRVFRGALCFRVLRIFHVVRKYAKMKVILLTFRASSAELLLLFLGVFMAVIMYATLIYYAEMTQGTDSFTNIPVGIWWAVITMTTVGYGDIVPTSVLGYIIGICCSLSGLLLLSMPIAIIAGNFSTYYSGLVAREQRVRRAHYLAEGFSKRINPLVTIPNLDSVDAESEKKFHEVSSDRDGLMNDFNITSEDLNPFRANTNFSFVYPSEIDNQEFTPAGCPKTSGSIYLGQSAQYLNENLFEGVETVQTKESFQPISAIKDMWYRSLGDLSRYENDRQHPFHRLVKSTKADSRASISSNSRISRSTSLLSGSEQNRHNYSSIHYESVGRHNEMLWSDEELVDLQPDLFRKGGAGSVTDMQAMSDTEALHPDRVFDRVPKGSRARSESRYLRDRFHSVEDDKKSPAPSRKRAATFSKSVEQARFYDNDCMDIEDTPLGSDPSLVNANTAPPPHSPLCVQTEDKAEGRNSPSLDISSRKQSKGKHKKKKKKRSESKERLY